MLFFDKDFVSRWIETWKFLAFTQDLVFSFSSRQCGTPQRSLVGGTECPLPGPLHTVSVPAGSRPRTESWYMLMVMVARPINHLHVNVVWAEDGDGEHVAKEARHCNKGHKHSLEMICNVIFYTECPKKLLLRMLKPKNPNQNWVLWLVAKFIHGHGSVWSCFVLAINNQKK